MLETRQLAKSFGEVHALRSTSIRVERGEFFSLLGPSGCGKTTLLRLLAGFEVPSQGGIYLEQAEITQIPAESRPFNLVFQKYALFPHMSVRENVAFGPRMKRWPVREVQDRVQEMLGLVRLEEFSERSVQTLSGGQQQRVALARALVNRPQVLLLDEPLSALDLKLREQMRVELRRLQRKLGCTFIFVTHDQDEAMALSDRIAVMNLGQVEQIGSPREIYLQPRTQFVAKFIGSINEIESGRFLRPEKIRISPANTTVSPNSMSASVTEVVYQGSWSAVRMRSADGRELVATLPDSEHLGDFLPGKNLQLSWDPKDIVCLGS